MEVIRAAVAGTPLAWCIVGAGAVALTAQLCLLLVARRRRAFQRRLRLAAQVGEWETVAEARVPRPHLETFALVALLTVPAATMLSVDRSREAVTAAFGETDPNVNARLLTKGWTGQLDAISLGIALEELAGGLGVIAWSLAFASRRQIGGLVHGARTATLDPRGAAAIARFPSPETQTVMACAGSVAALVLLPALHGAFTYCVLVGNRLPSLAAVAAPERLRHLDTALVEARRALEGGISASQVGLVLAALTCCGFAWWRSPERARRQWLGRPERRGPQRGGARGEVAWGTVACVLGSLSLYLVARPLKAENEMPWPNLAFAGEARLPVRLLSGVATPDLVGPDPVPNVPVLEVSAASVRLEGREIDLSASPTPAASRARLDHARVAGQASDEILIACDADMPARLLGPVLAAAQDSGFVHPVFVFGKRETVRRPAFGTLTRTRFSGAATVLVRPGVVGPAATVLRPADFGICADLAARIITLRAGGAAVGLLPVDP